MELHAAGEDALMLYLGQETSPDTSAMVQAAALAIESALGKDLVDLVPSYASLLIIYDPMVTDHLRVAHSVRKAVDRVQATAPDEGREVVLPVYYAPEVGKISRTWQRTVACQRTMSSPYTARRNTASTPLVSRPGSPTSVR